METLLVKAGLTLALIGFLLALHTGNLFAGNSKNIQKEIETLKSKEDEKSNETLLYYKINDFLAKLCLVITTIGISLLIIGLAIKLL